MQNIFVWWYHELFGEFSQHDLFGVCVVCCFSFPKSCSVCCHFGVRLRVSPFRWARVTDTVAAAACTSSLTRDLSVPLHSLNFFSRALFFRSSAGEKKTAKHVAQWRKYLKYFSNITRKCSSFKMRNNFHRSVTTTTTGAPTGRRNSYTRNEIRFAFLYVPVRSLRAGLRCSPESVSYRSVRLL